MNQKIHARKVKNIPQEGVYKTPFLLAAIMVAIISFITLLTLSSLYKTAFKQQTQRLTELAASQARLIEAVGRFDAIHSKDANPNGSAAATLSQIMDSHKHLKGFGRTGEFVLAKLDKNQIIFLLSDRHFGSDKLEPIDINSNLAEPMRRALKGESGTITGLDYRGVIVLAAFEPVAGLNWGIVAKIELSEIRQPFIETALITIISALILVIIGTALFMHISGGIVNKLQESEALHKSILDNAVDGIITTDQSANIISFNPAALTLFAYRDGEIIGRPLTQLFPVETRKQTIANIKKHFSRNRGNAKERSIAISMQSKDQEIIPVEITVSKARTRSQSVTTWIIRDVRKRRHLEEELERYSHELEELVEERTAKLSDTVKQLQNTQSQLIQNEKLASIGQLAAGVAHEINNPVGFVSSNISTLNKYIESLLNLIEKYSLLSDNCADQEAVKLIQDYRNDIDYDYIKDDITGLLEESLDGVKRVKQIVQDLKDFSRPGEEDWEDADLHKGLDSTLNIVHNELKYSATITKEYGDIPAIECIPAQLNQVFMNLLVNAGHAIDKNGTITIRTGRETDYVWVEIEDTGKGISADNIKKIFDPFFTTKDIGQGTGLGLSLSYGIIQKHNGSIDVKSEPGCGTTFRVTLPVKHSQEKISDLGQAKSGTDNA